MAEATSPTRSAQEGLRRMSLNSPPSHTDNPRQIKRAKVRLAGTRSMIHVIVMVRGVDVVLVNCVGCYTLGSSVDVLWCTHLREITRF